MGFGNGLHDSQAEARATTSARGRCETNKRMRQVIVRETCSMITNFNRYGITDTFSDKCHVTSTMGQRVIHQVAQRVLQALAIGHDRGLLRVDGDRPTLELGTTPGAVGHLVE
jgi:hypothetical protein